MKIGNLARFDLNLKARIIYGLPNGGKLYWEIQDSYYDTKYSYCRSNEEVEVNMDQNMIENISTSKVVELFTTPLLNPRINSQEKGPSWDGEIDYYSASGKQKKNRIGSCKVQIKGKTATFKDLMRESIKYPVEVADLNNFASEGGTLFLVVVIADKKSIAIYFNALMPYDIYKAINELKNKNQKTKTIRLKKINTDDENELQHIVKKFIDDKKQQLNITLDYVKQLPSLKESFKKRIPLSFSSDIKYIFTDDIYFYHKYDSVAQSVIGKVRFTEIGVLNSESFVVVNSKIYFKGKIKATFARNKIEMTLGSCFTICVMNIGKPTSKSTINFNLQGKLDDAIEGLEFAIAIVKNKSFYISGFEECKDVNIQLDVPALEKTLVIYNKIKILFTKLNVRKNVSVENFTKADLNCLEALYNSIIDSKPIELKNNEMGIVNISVCGLKFKFISVVNNEETFLLDAFQTEHRMKAVVYDETGKAYDVSVYSSLKKRSFLEIANVNFSTVLQSIKDVPYNPAHSEHSVRMLLELLHAYDQSKDKIMIDTAISISEWLIGCEKNEVNTINFYQCVKRTRPLTVAEKQELINLKSNLREDEMKDMYMAAIAILLDEKDEFDFYYAHLSSNNRSVFSTYPLMNLVKISA